MTEPILRDPNPLGKDTLMQQDAPALLVYITAPNQEEALLLARCLVNSRLAAGVNVLPGACSVYRWQGAVREEPEAMLIAQTRADRFAELEAAVRALHSYEVPCIVALPLCRGSADFLTWIDAETRPATPSGDA